VQQVPQRVLLLFHLSGQSAAFPVANVHSVAPMASLARPPGLPSVLEGILNLGGAAVPVLRLDRLFHLPVQECVALSEFQVMAQGRLQDWEPRATVSPTLPTAEALVDDPFYPRLKKRLVESTGLSYYIDKDTDLAGRIRRRLSVSVPV
jgi:hypothetical protein